MLFGKIQDSNVVDVANHTLEQDDLKYITGSRRSCSAVVRKMASDAHDGGTDEWLRDHQQIQHVNLITIDVESTTRVRQCVRKREPKLEKHLGNQGISAGGMVAPIVI